MRRRRGQEGFSLVVLMGGITVMLIFMGLAAPTWQHVMQDDREQELLYRGGAIADAIGRYQKKNGGALPVSLDVLVKGRFLRHAYKDPMTRDGQWRFIRQGEGITPLPGGTRPGSLPGPSTPSPSPLKGMGGGAGGAPLGGFVGVASRSTQKSLRMLNNAKSYDAWLFIAGRPRIVGKQPTIGTIGAPNLPSPGTRPSPPSPGLPQTPGPQP